MSVSIVGAREIMKYVCAFNRDRDSYQVPLALAEVGLLKCLVTDYYFGSSGIMGLLGRRLGQGHRAVEGLDHSLVTWNFAAIRAQVVARARRDEKVSMFKKLDISLSRHALAVAKRSGSGLFLYSGYAKEAFEGMDWGAPKNLFVFHPPATLSRELLHDDFEKFPEVEVSYRRHLDEIAQSDTGRVESEIAMADRIVCASTFTKISIERASHVQVAPRVVPYGCVSVALVAQRKVGRVRILFVGQGVQRKGLHHILLVWRRWIACHDAELRIVASKVDPWIANLATECGVRIESGLSSDELNDAYRWADIFVMPSLFEGFGLVYLEALSFGCYVVGSTFSGLPDIGLPDYAGVAVRPGDLALLEDVLDRAVKGVYAGSIEKSRIATWALDRSWAGFRAGIRSVV